jgi:putative FmdB family regulatory protein
MPCYEWICRDCDEHFEVLCSFDKRDNRQECPECGSKRTKRRFSTFTDYWPKGRPDAGVGLPGYTGDLK